MAATVDADHAIALLDEEQHLGVPVVGAERPAMMEDYGLPPAPVFVEDLCAVVSCDRVHSVHSVAAVGRSRFCEWLPHGDDCRRRHCDNGAQAASQNLASRRANAIE